MQTEKIHALIDAGVTTERQTGMLRRAIINLARGNDRSVTELEVQKVVNFVSEYVQHAPALLSLIENAATRAGLHDDLQPVIDAAEDYFLSPDDIIPDRYGLLGLLDDAYLTHSLMQAISDRVRAEYGKYPLPLEPHEDNAFIRRLIGEPFASILDEHVATTLNGPRLQNNITQIVIVLCELDLGAGPDPIWGNAQASSIADARLLAIGV